MQDRFVRPAAACGAATAALLVGGAGAARADRLVFERGGALYTAGGGGQDARRLLALPAGSLWAVSPDGRRLAWLERRPAANSGDAPAGLAGRPATLYLGDLSGRRRKRLLVTDRLTDRQGKKIVAVGVEGGAASGLGSLSRWEPVSLSFSADGRTLYLGCASAAASARGTTPRATVAADAFIGAPLVDGAGDWKVIAPFTGVDARGGLVAGVRGGVNTATGAAAVPAAPDAGAAVSLLRPGEGTSADVRAPGTGTPLLRHPALSPEAGRVAFAGVPRGLYVAGTGSKGAAAAPLLTEAGAALRPRWSSDGRRLLFLRPAAGSGDAADLYEVEVAPTGKAAGRPRRLLSGVVWFDVTPD